MPHLNSPLSYPVTVGVYTVVQAGYGS